VDVLVGRSHAGQPRSYRAAFDSYQRHSPPELHTLEQWIVIKITTMSALERELETYKSHLPELAGSEGKFVLIAGSDLLGTYDTYQDALAAGYEKLGLKPFLVKRVSSIEAISFFTRELTCPT
jgi:hypothetical protein